MKEKKVLAAIMSALAAYLQAEGQLSSTPPKPEFPVVEQGNRN